MRRATWDALAAAITCLMPEAHLAVGAASLRIRNNSEVTAGWSSGGQSSGMTLLQWGTALPSGRARFPVFFHTVVSIIGVRDGPDLERCGFLALDRTGALFFVGGVHWMAVGRKVRA